MNIEKLSLAELRKLNDRIVVALPIARAREMSAARKEMDDLVAAKGFTLAELIDTAPKGRRLTAKPAGTTRKTPAKLRDSKGVIWAGRGRMPNGFDKASAEPVTGA